MNHPGVTRACALSLLMTLALLGCSREQPPGTTAPPSGPSATAPPPASATVELKDVVETTPDYVIGISYPQSAAKYPALATELQRYAEAARAELLQAAQSRDAADAMLYDLSLSFTEVLDSPTLVAYAADGSSFTGGAHGMPLLARFVWLPRQGKRLTSTELVPGASGWQAIAGYVREELHTALSQRVDADELAPGERAEVVKSAGRMIDEGTAVDPENFAQFEPVVDARGKVTALRFVFAPYQVGPYSDGTQTVEVPASVLLPHVAPQYQDLFAR